MALAFGFAIRIPFALSLSKGQAELVEALLPMR